MTRALFLDRDGTINVDYGYVHEPEKFDFIPGVFDFCRQAQKLGYLIIIITNQSGIARGYFTESDYQRLTEFMCARFKEEGILISDVFHAPELSGPERKPAPGLFLKAREKYLIDMKRSINIGDKPRDLEAGLAAGIGTNLLFSGDFQCLTQYLALE